MSTGTQSGPVMDGADDASAAEKRAGLATQADHDHGAEASAEKTADLQQRTADADAQPE